ncbi:MAG TPA: LacI family transcriptional regulator [Runella sp.]|nr:LacI family transcriptional regulator [Runella sp.]HAO51549.1 LacI family transcriptional regulator [Runella sp.]
MGECKQCQSASEVVKAGFLRGRQRFYCKTCQVHFTMELPAASPQKTVRQTTIIDIAKSLGVAPSTVSRALNGSTDINSLTRQEILRVANEMDYRPNLLAQSLHRGETHTIGVVIPNIERPFFAGVLAGIQNVATEAGYRVMICQSNESHSTETLNVQALIASRVDGLLISHSKETTSFEHIRLQLKKGLPIVHFDRVCNEVETDKVVQEDFEGSFALVEHLIQQGCRRIAVCAGPPQLLISQTRLEGYKAALRHYGLPLDDTLIYHTEFKQSESLTALNHWLSLPEPPDGIFAVHYGNAIELLVELKRRKIQIPTEIAVVGFGDELIAELIEPSLTVFHLFPFEMGETAASLLIDNIIHRDTFSPVTKKMRGELRIRQSSMRL